MWWYVYVLINSKTKRKYIGYTNDIEKRTHQHINNQRCKFTHKFGPFQLIFFEAYLNEQDARNAEVFFKSGYGREVLRDKLKNYLSGL